ncbi:MAG: restriction endonuclease subunit S [Paludibacteraceae bacterium]|nr:restriction endonuclease subunit S [Paludibacteraceae bacterium]
MIETKFKHTEIGLIPHDWEVKNIKDCFDFKQGVQCAVNLQSLQQFDGCVRFIRIVDLTQPDELPRYIADPGLVHHVKKEDLFMVRYGSPGLVGYGYEGVIANNLFRLLPNIEICSKFYKYILTDLHDEILALSSSTTMPAVNFTALSTLQIPLPPTTAEQERIADALSKIDSLIVDLDELLEKKRAIKTGTMQQLLTGKKRLKGFTGEWVEKTIEEISELRKGGGLSKEKLDSNGKHKCILYGEIFTTYNYQVETCKSRTNYEEGLPSKIGDVLMPGSTTTKGIDLAKAVCVNEDDILLGGDIIVIRNSKQAFDPLFLATYLSEINKQAIAEIAQGITIIHIHAKQIAEVKLLIPPTVEEQRAIANILSAMDTEIASLEQKRDKYIAIKQGMMQQLLTGKIRLV